MTGGRKWTQDEQEYLQGHASTTPVGEIAARLGRTPMAVYEHAHRTGVSICAGRRRWTPDEVAYMRAHADEGREAVARALGRTPDAVRNKAYWWAAGVPTRPRSS